MTSASSNILKFYSSIGGDASMGDPMSGGVKSPTLYSTSSNISFFFPFSSPATKPNIDPRELCFSLP